MLEDKSLPLLVGVESVASEALLVYAAAEARRRRCGIHLVHVLPSVYGGAPEIERLTAIAGELRRDGEAVLSAAAARLAHLLEGDAIPLSTELAHGAVAASLVHAARHSCVVLVQHEGMGPAGNTAAVSITRTVAAHAPVPTVAVPNGWSSAGPHERAVVGVAVDEVDGGAAVLRQAFEEAHRRQARLRLIHAWGPGSLDPDDVPHLRAEACERAARELEQAIAELAQEWPSVHAECVVLPGGPEAVLLDQAKDLDVLVLGRHHPVPLGRHLGPVLRGVLRWSRTPVMVVDPTRGPRHPNSWEVPTCSRSILR